MKTLSFVSIAMMALIRSAIGLHAADSETKPDHRKYKFYKYTEAGKSVRTACRD